MNRNPTDKGKPVPTHSAQYAGTNVNTHLPLEDLSGGDPLEATHWLRKAAAAGNESAITRLKELEDGDSPR